MTILNDILETLQDPESEIVIYSDKGIAVSLSGKQTHIGYYNYHTTKLRNKHFVVYSKIGKKHGEFWDIIGFLGGNAGTEDFKQEVRELFIEFLSGRVL